MKVKATARGFYGKLYDPGQVFELADEAHLGSWMIPVDPKDCERLSATVARLKKNHRHAAGPDVPATTAMLKNPIMPKANPKADVKPKVEAEAPAKVAPKPKE